MVDPDQGLIFPRTSLYPDPEAVDSTFRSRGLELLAGVDEAGRGALAGPLVAAAVILKEDCGVLSGLRDSKALTALQRNNIIGLIGQSAVAIGIGVVDAADIDVQGIEKSAMQAMSRAVLRLSRTPELLLIDGRRGARLPLPQCMIIKGDAKSQSIAAASVMAKVTRDRIMLLYHRFFPQYGFDRHKGYGTESHLEAIDRFGVSTAHRRSFRGVKRPENEGDLPLFRLFSATP